MNKVILKSWLASSENPEKVSKAITGFLLSFTSIVVYIAQVKGWTLVSSEWTLIATQLGIAGGAIWFLFGLVMKGVVKLGSVKPPVEAQQEPR